jgi:hypothetical protein
MALMTIAQVKVLHLGDGMSRSWYLGIVQNNRSTSVERYCVKAAAIPSRGKPCFIVDCNYVRTVGQTHKLRVWNKQRAIEANNKRTRRSKHEGLVPRRYGNNLNSKSHTLPSTGYPAAHMRQTDRQKKQQKRVCCRPSKPLLTKFLIHPSPQKNKKHVDDQHIQCNTPLS